MIPTDEPEVEPDDLVVNIALAVGHTDEGRLLIQAVCADVTTDPTDPAVVLSITMDMERDCWHEFQVIAALLEPRFLDSVHAMLRDHLTATVDHATPEDIARVEAVVAERAAREGMEPTPLKDLIAPAAEPITLGEAIGPDDTVVVES